MSQCPGCGYTEADDANLPPLPPDRHASPQCWRQYERLLSRSYGIPEYRGVHQLVVDVYVAQHPGGTARLEVQRMALCLMTLCLFVEDDVDVKLGAVLHKRMMRDRPGFFHALDAPRLDGLMTAHDTLAATDAAEHDRLVRRWGAEVWRAWEPHHATVREWNRRCLGPDWNV